jgi:hypothetical protein
MGFPAAGTAGGPGDQTRRRTTDRISGRCNVVLFGGGKLTAGRDCRQFIFPNAPEQELFLAGIRVKAPGALLIDERHRKRPVFATDVQHQGAVGFAAQAMHLLVFLYEQFAVQFVLIVVVGDSEFTWLRECPRWPARYRDARLQRRAERRRRGEARLNAWLTHSRGREAYWLWRWKFKLADTQARFDPDKYGWPWLPGASSWVIPTAFSLIALKQFVSCTPSEAARQRIRTGVEMLFDRACVGGGWNAGNSVVYGAPLAPHVEPTAIALMALQDELPNEIIRDSLAWLKHRAENLTAISSLAWSILSLFLYGVPVGELKRRLADRTGDGSQVRENAVLAVATLALQCGEMIHPFALIR